MLCHRNVMSSKLLDSLAIILSSLCAIFLCLLQFEWGSNDNLLGKIHNGFS